MPGRCLREFVNTVLAEPWDDEAQTSVDISELMGRREHYRAPVPAGVAVLTCGVDVQSDRLELVGWGLGEESWSIEYRVIPGDPTGSAVWRELQRTDSKKEPLSGRRSERFLPCCGGPTSP